MTESSLIPSVLANSRIIRYVYSKSSQCLSLHALLCSQCLLAVCTGSATAAVCPHSPLPNSSRELCCSHLNLFYSWGESLFVSLSSVKLYYPEWKEIKFSNITFATSSKSSIISLTKWSFMLGSSSWWPRSEVKGAIGSASQAIPWWPRTPTQPTLVNSGEGTSSLQ